MCRQAPSCRAVLDQATALWPNRRKDSDGICASSRHTSQNPASDHEPNINGYASAVDLSDDKANGCDADAWAEWLRVSRDARVKYVICNERMFSSYPARGCDAWEWRHYDGANPHESHTHLSVLPDALFDTSPWFPTKDDDVTPEQIDEVVTRVVAALKPGIDKALNSLAGYATKPDGSRDAAKRSTTGRIEDNTNPKPA
jgi:hypothetical protein